MIKYIQLLMVTLLGAATFYKDSKEKTEITKNFNRGVYLLFFFTLIISGIDIAQSGYIEREFWYQGEIQGSEIDTPIFKIGTANFILGGELETLFNVVGDPIKIWLYNGKLQLYTIVRNEKGKLMVSVIGNDFVVNPNTVSDFNYDDDSLEVLDKSGDVILQIQMQDDGVLFCGKYNMKDGRKFGIGNNIIEIKPVGEELEIYFEKIFSYPGKDNLGLRK